MKYIITEEQYSLLKESPFERWVRRRTDEEYLGSLIEKQLEDEFFQNPCDFGDEFEFADNVIEYVIDEFFGNYTEDYTEDSKYPEMLDMVRDFCKQSFGEDLFDRYREECEEL